MLIEGTAVIVWKRTDRYYDYVCNLPTYDFSIDTKVAFEVNSHGELCIPPGMCS